MADFYIITKVTTGGDTKHEVFSANQFTAAQVKALHPQKLAEGGMSVAIYREVSETVANQIILKK
jgi:hypothetical protein